MTMNNQEIEKLREEFNKYSFELASRSDLVMSSISKLLTDWWLSKIDELLNKKAEAVENLKVKISDTIEGMESKNNVVEEIGAIIEHGKKIGNNSAISKAVDILKGNKE